MNGELRRITVDEMMLLGQFAPCEADSMYQYGLISDPLLVGTYNGELIAFVGLCPPTILSDEAYAWLWTTSAVARHKVAFGRFAQRLIRDAIGRYPRIVGHCPCESWRWLRSLGAHIIEAHDGYFKYEIRSTLQ